MLVPRGSEPIVGREEELAQLDALLARVDDGVAGCVAIEGDPGIGKTRLLAELKERAQIRGHLVLRGSAAEFERELPFGVWVDALDAYVAAWTHPAEDPQLEALAAVLPSRRERPAGHLDLIAEERFRAHRAVRRLLELLAADRPLVVILDDLHWADAASIELNAALLRREIEAPVLLAMAFRSRARPAKARAALGQIDAALITLAPLTAGDSARLIAKTVEGAQRDAIVAESAGNPFFVLQLARATAMPAREPTGGGPSSLAGVPAAVADALLSELDMVSGAARALIEAAAIAGDPFEFDLASGIAELPLADGFDALDELVGAGLLRETEVPRRFSFRHPLVRRAVYESTRAGWRLTAHARAADLLGAQGAPAAARAHHLEQCAASGDTEAISVLLETADAAKARSPAAAARWYATALRLMPADDSQARLDVLIALASAQRSIGANDRCCETLAGAIRLVRPQDSHRRMDITARLAASELFLGRHQLARQRLAAVADEMPDRESRPAVLGLLAQASAALFASDHASGRDLAERALAAARMLGDAGLTGEAAAVLAHVATVQGDVALGASVQADAVAMMDNLPDDVLALHLDAVHRLSRASLHLERYEDAVRVAERGLDVATRSGQGELLSVIRSTRAQSSLALGRIDVASEAQDAAIEAARLVGNDYVTCGILSTTANIALMVGDLETALRAGKESVEILGPASHGHVLSVAKAALAVTMREAGRPAADTARLVEALGGWTLERLPAVWRVRHLEALTRISLGEDDVDAAAASARGVEAAAQELALPVAVALAQRARAGVLLAQDQAAQAVELAVASAASAAERGARIEAARSLTLAGRAGAAAGDEPRAVQLLRQSEAELDACGALHPRDEARRELRRLGARVERRGPGSAGETGVGSLSKRERQVSELVAEHKTNREIGRALYLSEKTIESHLRNIFFKLDVRSRQEVAHTMWRYEEEAATIP